MEITRPAYLEVDVNKFKKNVEQIQKQIGNHVKIMPVLKANAYGTYLQQLPEVLNLFEIIAVATVDEAVEIRKTGYDKEILVLNQPFETEIEKIITNKIIVGISSYEFAQKLANCGKLVTVHVEIGTGMGRTGIHPYKVEPFLKSLEKNIKVEGIYTHFSSADTDDEYSKHQLKSFGIAIETAEKVLGKIKYIHAAASNALLNYPESHFNLVRPGMILYGYPAAEDTMRKIALEPITKLKAKISFLKTVEKGTSIGYNRSYITKKETKVATIPIGYADGFRRELSNGWNVLIRGQKVPIIGKICMDSFMADVTSLKNVEVGDDVILWDNKNITLEEIAEKCHTINYEILSTVGSRVPRKYLF